MHNGFQISHCRRLNETESTLHKKIFIDNYSNDFKTILTDITVHQTRTINTIKVEVTLKKYHENTLEKINHHQWTTVPLNVTTQKGNENTNEVARDPKRHKAKLLHKIQNCQQLKASAKLILAFYSIRKTIKSVIKHINL